MPVKKSFIQGAFILVLAGFANRVIGFLYRIFAVRVVGPEGIGLFEMVFPIYTLVLVVTTAGVPPAVSKLVSERISQGKTSEAKTVFRAALVFLCCAGAASTALLLFLTPVLVRMVLVDPRVYWCLITLAPAVFIISVSSAFRGYFQGLQQMVPTAVSQVIEQLTRVFSGIYLASRFLPLGTEYGVAGLAAGTVLGELAGLMVMVAMYISWKRKEVRLRKSPTTLVKVPIILVSLFSLALPISLSRVVNSLQLTLQAVIIPQRLQAAGFTLRQATELYGQFSGIALALLGLPTIITFSLAITLVPAISEAAAVGNYRLLRMRGYKAIQLSLITGLPAAAVFFLFPEYLCGIIFHAPEAGYPLKVLAVGCIFLYLAQTTSGILQGLGKVGTHLRNSLIGAVINLFLIYFLTSVPTYGIIGTAWAMNVGWAVIAVLNTASVFYCTGMSLNIKKLIIVPVMGAVIMGGMTYTASVCIRAFTGSQLIITVGSLAAGCTVYAAYLLLSGTVTKEDIAQIPGFGPFFNSFIL